MNKRRILAVISMVIVVAGAVLLLVLLNGKNGKTDTSVTPTVTPTVAPTDTVAPTSSQADTAAQTRVFDEAGRDYWFTGCGKGAVWFDQYFFDLIQNRSDLSTT